MPKAADCERVRVLSEVKGLRASCYCVGILGLSHSSQNLA